MSKELVEQGSKQSAEQRHDKTSDVSTVSPAGQEHKIGEMNVARVEGEVHRRDYELKKLMEALTRTT